MNIGGNDILTVSIYCLLYKKINLNILFLRMLYSFFCVS